VFTSAFAFALARPCPFSSPYLARVLARRIFPPPPAFARPVSRLQGYSKVARKADSQVSVRSPSRLEISVAAENLVFNPDDSWDTAEITSRPNAPVVIERPRPETRPLARKNLYVEFLLFVP
jgi:hypothetical protein